MRKPGQPSPMSSPTATVMPKLTGQILDVLKLSIANSAPPSIENQARDETHEVWPRNGRVPQLGRPVKSWWIRAC